MKLNKKIIFALLLFSIIITSISAISAEEFGVTVTADNSEPITATVTADVGETNTTGDSNTSTQNTTPAEGVNIEISDFGYVIYGTPHNLTIKVTNATNNDSIIGRHMGLQLTRLSTGATKTYDSVTDYNGTAYLEINLAPGTYGVNAIYLDEPKYNKYNTFNIYRIPTFFIQSNFEVNRQGERYITRLYSLSNYGPVANQTVQLTFTNGKNSKTYDLVTDDNGIALLPINFGVGTYNVTSTYAGGGVYSPSSNYTNSITVYPTSHKMPTTITIIGSENGTTTISKGETLRFRLTENNGLLMPQSTIKVQLAKGSSKKTYTLNTGSTGEASMAINLGAGTYTVTASYASTYYFNSTTTVNTLVVNA